MTADRTMNALTPMSGQAEGHNNLPSPFASPKLFQDPSDIIRSEPITDIHLAKWKAEDNLIIRAKIQTPESSPSAAQLCQHTSDIDPRNCEPMSPPDNYSVDSSPQHFGWPSSSDSGESEPWTLHHHELLPDHSAYANSPSSPAGGWDCSVPYQFQSAPTSAGYFSDCGAPFSAATPPPMQANYSPVFEMPSNYGSPQYPPSHFGDASPTQQRPMAPSMPEMSPLVNEPTSHPDYAGAMQTPPSDYLCSSDLGKGKNDINSLPYSQLLFRAFMSSNTRKLSLRQIYQWFEENTNKAVNNKGWQNSIRHNLSMNRAFEKAPLKEDGTESRRATEWVLADWALEKGVQSTTRYRKGNVRSKSHGSERDRMVQNSYSGSRRGPLGYHSRGRERLYSQRMPLHGMPTDTHLAYGAPMHSPHLATSLNAFVEVDGYMTPGGGISYSPADVHPGYNGFNPEDGASSNGYPLYNLGEANMDEYVMVGSVPDGPLVGAAAHAGGVVAQAAVPYGTQHISSGLSGLAGQMASGQHQQNYATTAAAAGDYDSSSSSSSRQGMRIESAEGVHE